MSTNPIDGIVPTLYIGLGGTGKNVLLRLRKRLRKHFNGLSELSQFLLIDTDLQKPGPDGERLEDFESVLFRPDAGEVVDCCIRPEEFAMAREACNFRNDPRFRDWIDHSFWDRFRDYHMDYGAACCRQAGRLAFLLKYPKIRNAVRTQLRKLAVSAGDSHSRLCDYVFRENSWRSDGFIRPLGIDPAKNLVFCDSLEIVIVTSLGGGTGSGMLLDVAYLVRDLLTTDFNYGNFSFQTAIAIFPTVFERLVDSSTARRLQQNAYAALLEIESYSKTPESGENIEFIAPWERDPLERRISGRPWDACYLVDDVHENLPGGAVLESADLFQKVADFLHHSFVPTELATRYRALRAGLQPLQERCLALQAADLDPDTMDAEPRVLFEARVSCEFRSFGLAEISVSQEQVSHAAGYLLAAMNLEECGLGDAARYSHAWYVERMNEDLLRSRPAEHPEFISLKPDDLLLRLVTRGEMTFLEALDRQFEQAARLNSQGWRMHLEQALAEHCDQLAPGGRGRSLMEEQLLCDHVRLMAQLSTTTLSRCVQVGLNPLLALLKVYSDALSSADSVLSQRQRAPLAAEKLGTALFASLRTAEESWMPGFIRKRRVAREYAATCKLMPAAIVLLYQQAALDLARRLYADLRAFIGDNEHTASGSTLTRNFGELSRQLRRAGDALRSRFQESCTGGSRFHIQQLQPEWTADDYAVEIRSVCLRHPGIGPVAPSTDVVDWQRAADVITRNLNSDATSDRARPQLDLGKLWVELGKSNDLRGRQWQENCERLAAACRHVLKVSPLRARFETVTECLASIPSDERERILCRLIDHGSVCLLLHDSSEVGTRGHAISRRAVLSLDAASDQGSQDSPTRQSLCEEFQKLAVFRSRSADATSLECVRGSSTNFVLMTFASCVPLQSISRIEQLRESYHARELDDSMRLAHIDCRFTWRDLPGLVLPSESQLAEIRNSADVVLAGVLLGTIAQDDAGEFSITVKDSRYEFSSERHGLGRSMNRIIEHACDLPEVRECLRRWWADWRSAATLKSLAGLWLAIDASRARVTDVYSERVAGPRYASDPPLANLLRKLRKSVERDLESRPDGPALLERLNASAPAVETAPDSLRAWAEQYVVEIRGLPLYRLDAERLKAIELP